jgi:type VI secretion system FHA domain protein
MAQNWNAPATQAPPAPAPADDPWARFSSSHAVDWARGFDEPATPPASAPAPAGRPAGDAAWQAFLSAAGLSDAALKASPDEAAAAAGGLLKRLVAGLVVMIEARARAKAQLGAQSTTLELNGNNPIKFARSPDKALEQLLNPPERGFMDANLAVEDSFRDLQAHQMATLAAMQGALRTTLERFSPSAISARAETRGLMAKILPGARNAALWDAYQKEFDGVAQGSDEAFLDVFSKAFREAYDRASNEMKLKGR